MTTILYHSNCYDGFGAAWAAWGHFGVSAQYRPMAYGEPIPEFPDGDDLYLVDFSFDRATIEDLRARGHAVTVIDHHKTAVERLEGLADVHLDLEHSGAVLTWRFFHGARPTPTLLLYIEDRDLWRFDRPHSREIDCWVKSHRFDFGAWSEMASAIEHDIDGCVLEGAAILRSQTRMVSMICDQAYWTTVAGYEVPAVNSTAYWSEVGHKLLERYPDASFTVSYFDRADGRRQFSLRSRPGFDCSAIAKQFGGGGHAQAAGFEVGRGTPL